VPTLSGCPFALPDLSLVGDFSFGSFGRVGVLAAVMLLFTLVFANFFDAMGTFTGLAREISPLLWIVAAGFVLYFARSWIGL
jgi:AGZA family xanthine/uracil permease-like MFS transporter